MAKPFDVVVLGAGAAGMMAAIRAGQRGRTVLVLDHAKAPGEKIRISGGGRCNFTNTRTTAQHFYSCNPHFAKSALARYTPQDFIAQVQRHNIPFHEKTLGQLFCDTSAKDIVQMLVRDMLQAGVRLELSTEIGTVEKTPDGFEIATSQGPVKASSLIVATGGKSIPKMGATGFAYRIASQFGLDVVETRPGLVPLTLDPAMLEKYAPLAGIAVQARVRLGKTQFEEGLLFTHRGLSGPSILQISSVWREGETLQVSFEPDAHLATDVKAAKRENGKQGLPAVLSAIFPKRLAQFFAETVDMSGPLADLPDRTIEDLEKRLRTWPIKPAGSEGYRTAEVTMGGVDTAGLDSRTMEAKYVPGLFFIGECVDVTGWLGGYNFQWAWSSGHAAGSHA